MADLKQRHNAVQKSEEPSERKWTELSPAALKKEEPPERKWVELSPASTASSRSATSSQPNQGEASIDGAPQHPPGYNKRKRDIVKLVLVVVAAGLLRGDPKMATVLSVVAMVCLKEGTFWSTRNLKWMGLCVMSFGMSLISWCLERGSDDVNEEKAYTRNSMLWVSSKTIQLCWGMTLSVFLVSAYAHGHNSLLEFEFLNETAPLPPSGPRKDPPPKTYLLY